MRSKNNFVIFTSVFLVLVLFSSTQIYAGGSSQDLNVNASVVTCSLELIIKPEKRIPPTNNWGTESSIGIFKQTGENVVNFELTTAATGRGVVNLCSKGIQIFDGNYTFTIKGFSHLRKTIENITGFDKPSKTIDLSTGNNFLLGGETSVVFDNYINALDLSTQLKTMYTGDYKNDINQDGKVNGLDLSITLFNYFEQGD